MPKRLAKDMTVSSNAKATYLLVEANEEGPLNPDEVCGGTLSVAHLKAGLRELVEAGYVINDAEGVFILL